LVFISNAVVGFEVLGKFVAAGNPWLKRQEVLPRPANVMWFMKSPFSLHRRLQIKWHNKSY